jgi:HD superfamily phosphohydrolase
MKEQTNNYADYKIFWDAVHGQIKIPTLLCRIILDTEHFQRLKRLEQTNTRPLYPCAHHDRFIHSLGTYHLGCFLFNAVYNNSKKTIEEFELEKNKKGIVKWDILELEFTIACLLHDIGHAPFSHTFEQYYQIDTDSQEYHLLNKIILEKDKFYSDLTDCNSSFEEFEKDFQLVLSGSKINIHNLNGAERSIKLGIEPKPHELVSAFIVMIKFTKIIRESFGDEINPFNIIRMILGIKFSEGYTNRNDIKKQVLNCFITLLNGGDVDVDKIDYIIRDQWATGNLIRHIDYQRLLNSVYIRKDPGTGILVNCFHKKAINELITLKQAGQIIKTNIFEHPIVKYDDYLLKKAVNQSVKKELEFSSSQNDSGEENYVSKIVSVEALLNPTKFYNCEFYLPTDDDLIYLLKKHIKDCDYAKEWQSRDYRLKAIWKTYFDYNYHFKKLNQFEKKILFRNVESFTINFFKKNTWETNPDLSNCYYIEREVKGESKFEFKEELNILIKGELIKFDQLFDFEKNADTHLNSGDKVNIR